MVTITQDGKKVGITSSIGNYFKVSGTRSTPRILGAAAALYGAGVILKTAYEQTGPAVSSLISNATLGGYNLESIVGDDPESSQAKVTGVVLAGLTLGLGYLGWKYVISPLWNGGKKVVSQSSELASESYEKRESYRNIEDQVKLAGAQADAQVAIASIESDAQRRITTIKRTGAI